MPGTRVRPVLLLALGLALAASVPSPSSAQFQQYVPPGEFEEERESMQEQLERAMKTSRWRVGRFFASPWLGLRNVAYLDNALGESGDNPQSDVTATLGAGLRLYRPIGTELTFAAHALPEYVWWQDLAERRRVNGRYGAGLFGNLGRTGLELSATRVEDAFFFSREVETPVNTRYDIGAADLEVGLGAGISLFAGGEVRLIRYLGQDDPTLAGLELLDRDEEILRGGLRIDLTESFTLGLGAEESTAMFEARGAARDRSNSGTSPILQLEFRGTALDLTTNLASRELEPEPGSDFVAYDEVTGSARLQLTLGRRLKPQLYGNKNLVYSTQQPWAYFEDTAFGLGIRASLGRLASLRLFAEEGTNDYTSAATGNIDRRDDLEVLGAEIRINFGRYFLLLGGSRTEYDSNFDLFDREVTVIRSGVGAVGGGGSPWG